MKEIKIKKCKFELKWGDDMAYFSNILEKIKGDIELSDFESVRGRLNELEGYNGLGTHELVEAANAINEYNAAVMNITNWLQSDKMTKGSWSGSDSHIDELNEYLKTAQSNCKYFEDVLTKLSD